MTLLLFCAFVFLPHDKAVGSIIYNKNERIWRLQAAKCRTVSFSNVGKQYFEYAKNLQIFFKNLLTSGFGCVIIAKLPRENGTVSKP